MADRSIFDLTIAGLNRTDDDLADVGTDADLEIYSFFNKQSLREAAHVFLQTQSCI
jgi:hypothetical protein